MGENWVHSPRAPRNTCARSDKTTWRRWEMQVNLEHKAEHNNCRMRAPGPDLEAPSPIVSP
jgi:hypothetical protein